MKLSKRIVVAAAALSLAGCGLGPDFSGGFGGIGSLGGCLEVTNDASSGHALVTVRFLDVASAEIVRQEAVTLAPGQSVDLMDVPAGPYIVVGIYDDGLSDPVDGKSGTRVEVIPEDEAEAQGLLEASVTFTRP